MSRPLSRYVSPAGYVRYVRRVVADRRANRYRAAAEAHYGRSRPPVAAEAGGPAIVCEGMWDNPNHFFRLHLMLTALSETGRAPVIGVLHRRGESRQRRSLRRLGAREFLYLEHNRIRREQFDEQARRLLAGVNTHRDLLRLELPHALPAYTFYDTVLKIARHPQPPVDSPLWSSVLAEVLRNIAIYGRLFRERRIAAVVTSHPWKNEFATLTWLALVHGVPCYYVTGFCEATRVRRFTTLEDFATPVEHGTCREFDALPPMARRRVIEYGRAYLAEREQGTSSDINARYAFRRDRRAGDRVAARRALGIDGPRPVAAVFAQVWFDFPHTFAMQNFTDFLDWMRLTIERIAENTSVTWVLKPHPCDAWYGGVRLRDIVGALPPHVHLCSEDTDSLTVQLAADVIVTVHGTVGIEAAARGCPILNADRSHYTEWGFTHVAKSREDYAELLARIDSLTPPTLEQRERAMAFAALALAPPPEALGLVRTSCDTSDGALLYRQIAERFRRDPVGLAPERQAIGEWLAGRHPSYAAAQTVRWCQGD
jgi:hypothetical protein